MKLAPSGIQATPALLSGVTLALAIGLADGPHATRGLAGSRAAAHTASRTPTQDAPAAPGTGVSARTITAFGGPTAAMPEGWVLCNGSLMTGPRFDRLRSILGETWGEKALPDLRGQFLRGAHGVHGVDRGPRFGRASLDLASQLSREVAPVGSYQGDALQRHSHELFRLRGAAFSASGMVIDMDGEASDTGFLVRSSDRHPEHTAPLPMGGLGPGARAADETRPKNAAVNWIIKL